MSLHPVVERASEGKLPSWAAAGPTRMAHMARVASLLSSWASALGLSEEDRRRWASIGYLHDAVREADPEVLRARVAPTLADLPDRVLHGPAASSMLRDEGVQDEEILGAVAWHTLGHPELGAMGRALYAADFLEPGRNLLNEWRGRLRERLPEELDDVVRDVLAARIAHVVEGGGALRPETVGFWNALAVRP